eukprot:PhF_6_TR34190/c1_g2_i1/m.50083
MSIAFFHLLPLLFMYLHTTGYVQGDSVDTVIMYEFTKYWSCKDPSWQSSSSLCNWAGVTCSNDRIITFDWSSRQCQSTQPLNILLPPSVTKLILSTNEFSGSVQLSNLPQNLTELDLSNNQFTGSVDFSSLPKLPLTVLRLNSNQFIGSVNL